MVDSSILCQTDNNEENSNISLPNIGDSFILANFKKGLILVNSAQISPCYSIMLNNIRFLIAVSDDDIVNYIYTSDSTFITQDGISTKNTLNDLKEKFGDKLFAEPGFAWYFKLPSGWNAGILKSDKSFGIKWPDGNKRISFLFKR